MWKDKLLTQRKKKKNINNRFGCVGIVQRKGRRKRARRRWGERREMAGQLSDYPREQGGGKKRKNGAAEK